MSFSGFIDSASGVAQRQHYVPARLRWTMPRPKVLIELHHLGLNCELSALWHGVACIDGKVQKNLLQLSLVATNGRKSAAGPKRQSNVFTDDASQHVTDVADESVQIQWLG